MASRTVQTASAPQSHSHSETAHATDTPVTALIVGGKNLPGLTDRLRHPDIITTIINSRQTVLTHLKHETVDVIFAPADKRGTLLFAELRRQIATPPLLIAISIDMVIVDCSSADIVLQNNPHLLQNVLWNARSQRQARRIAPTATPNNEIELLKTMIVKTVSHELRTPLLQVKSAIALLADGEQDRERLLGYATESTARLENVVLNITRLAESLDIKPEPVVPVDAVNYAMRHLRRSWDMREKADRVVIETSPHLLPVIGDRQAIGVALQLLLDNALKFSDKAVVLSVIPLDNHQTEFRVSDSGIGMTPDALERIFEPFYQVDHINARKFNGSGVGLAIVRLILERHNASIQVTSQVGQGSSFAFALPTIPGELPF